MANLIPMAGIGSRFAKEGYKLPKALIPVSGVPMIIKVIRNLPQSNKWVFVVRQEHIDEFHIDEVIKGELPHAIIIPVSGTTEGQACTCLLAAPYLDKNEELFIAACDNGYLYDKKRYESLKADRSVSSILWTFTQRENLTRNPKAWGWVKLAEDGLTIENMSVKVPVSDDPFNDHAVVATFWFRRARDFIDAADLMIKENHRINNEFYVDAIPIFLKKLGKRSVIFDVGLYVGWGTPQDLYDYQLMEFLVSNKIEPADKRLYELYTEYFRNAV